MTVVATNIPAPGDAATVQAIGSIWLKFFSLAFSSTYATGGDAWDPGPTFAAGVGATICVNVSGGAGYDFEYDNVNKKLKCFSAAGTELAAGAYPAALTGDVNTVAQVYAK